jgi:hypothetical protein
LAAPIPTDSIISYWNITFIFSPYNHFFKNMTRM